MGRFHYGYKSRTIYIPLTLGSGREKGVRKKLKITLTWLSLYNREHITNNNEVFLYFVQYMFSWPGLSQRTDFLCLKAEHLPEMKIL